MSSVALQDGLSLRAPLVLSAAIHLAAATALLLTGGSRGAPSAPVYRVSLIAAAPGPRQIGVVQPLAATPQVTPPKTPPPLAREVAEPERMKAPAKAPPVATSKVATPNAVPTAKTPVTAPAALGGPEGGRGADVANVKVDGIEFPYPVYLQNVVRQIALQFKPSARGALQAEVAFLIRRDGTIAGLRLTRRSSVYSFDQDALAAVELASRAFGPLPAPFPDDVLPVVFSFDPRLIR